MNTIHTKHLNVAILHIDLQKAYDSLDCGFLYLVLSKIKLRPRCVDWIMACVDNVNYTVIINRYPTKFFCVGWGLQQGCPLSPLLFILAMDSLSLHIKKVVLEDQF